MEISLKVSEELFDHFAAVSASFIIRREFQKKERRWIWKLVFPSSRVNIVQHLFTERHFAGIIPALVV